MFSIQDKEEPMRFAHFGHSCVLVETGSARLLFDPGTFSSGYPELRDLTGILITHQHFDHLDEATLPDLVKANPQAELVVDADTMPIIQKLGLTARVAAAGDAFELGGAAINVVGGRHAFIYGGQPDISNAGYLVDHGAFYHPGDSLHVPEQAVDVLGAPVVAPWLKLAEAVDFVRAVRPRVTVPIHEALLANPQLGYTWLANFSKDVAPVTILERAAAPTAV
jgi:L-ascorbate metabolism protein UlaG (beta-lactamase superfamily)